MKVNVEAQKPQFQPIVVTLTLETREELHGFASMFSHSAIGDATRELGFNSLPLATSLRKFEPNSDHTHAAETIHQHLHNWRVAVANP